MGGTRGALASISVSVSAVETSVSAGQGEVDTLGGSNQRRQRVGNREGARHGSTHQI